jgi:hypothetical protein
MKENLVIGVICTLFGILITAVYNKFKNRIVTLRYKVWHSSLGASINDPKFGSVKVLYNESEVTNLFMSTLELKNDSQKDIENFNLDLKCNDNSMILVSRGTKKDSIKELNFTTQFQSLLDTTKQEEIEKVNNIMRTRNYNIPILNRGEKIEISMITSNFKRERPYISAEVEQKGIKIKEQGAIQQEIFGEPLSVCVILGVLISVLILFPVTMLIKNVNLELITACIVGTLSTLWGLIIIKAYRLIVSLIS